MIHPLRYQDSRRVPCHRISDGAEYDASKCSETSRLPLEKSSFRRLHEPAVDSFVGSRIQKAVPVLVDWDGPPKELDI